MTFSFMTFCLGACLSAVMLSISSMVFARRYEKRCRENLRSSLGIVRGFLDERHAADERFLERVRMELLPRMMETAKREIKPS